MAAGPQKLIVAAIAVALALVARADPRATARQDPAPAQRIVSLVPAVTEMLFALGAGQQLVAVSSYDDFPPEAKALPRVGALLDPDVERILALRPDLVISYGSQTDLQTQLGRSGIRVLSYRHAGLAGVFDTLLRVGSAVGRGRDARGLADALQSQLNAIRAAVRGAARPRTLLVFERDPGTLRGIYVSGGRGFLHEMLEIAGGTNVFADVAREAVQPSQETLLARAPEVIIEVRGTGLISPATDRAAGRAWASLAAIPAVRNRRVHVLVGDHLVVPGPRVAQGTEALARALHPEAFR